MIHDLEPQRTRRLARRIARDLRAAGGRTLTVPVADVEDLARWRRAAIQAAHALGERASTRVVGDQVTVEVHRPVTMADRRAAAALAATFLPPRP